MRLLRRRPPFALVLVAVVALFVGAIALFAGGGGSSANRPGVPPGTGPAEACVTTRAAGVATVRSAARAVASASVPVTVVEHATVGGRVVATELSETVAEQAAVARPVLVHHGAVASARACARGSSPVAARSTALTRAYKNALAAARARAHALAAAAARAYVARLAPSTLATARSEAAARARAAAAAARPALERKALAQARTRAD